MLLMLNNYTVVGVGGERSDLKVFSSLSHTLRCLGWDPQSWLGPQAEISSISTPTPISKLKPEIMAFVSLRLPRQKENQPVQTGYQNDIND